MKKQRITARLNELHPNDGRLGWLPSNPRQWTKDDIRRTKESLERDPDFLEDRPVLLVSCENGFIVFAGNLRCTAAKEAKLKSVPAVVYEPENDEDRETIKRRSILDNGSFGSWDFDALANEWDDLPLVDFGVPAWETFTKEEEQKPVDITEDGFNEDAAEIETRCKPGDIWQLGEHRLLCGDSTDEKTFVRLLEGNEARLCVTSPPYGVGKDYEEKGIGPWEKTIFGVIDAITKHTRIVVWNIGDLFATGTQFIEPTSMYSTRRFKENGFPLMYVRIWKKQGGNFAGTEPYYTVSMKPVQEYEWLLCYGKGDYEKDYAPIIKWLNQQAFLADLDNSVLKEITGAGFMFGHWFTSHQWAMIDRANYEKIAEYCRQKSINAFERDYDELRREYENLNIYGKILTKEEESAWGQWAIWEIATVNRRTGDHPAEFPVELPARCIKMHSRPGDIILEPFCGAGTTLIAAEQLGRRCYGVELDPHYCDIILARWEQFTGKKAEKIA
jgi:DNA modification methylase